MISKFFFLENLWKSQLPFPFFAPLCILSTDNTTSNHLNKHSETILSNMLELWNNLQNGYKWTRNEQLQNGKVTKNDWIMIIDYAHAHSAMVHTCIIFSCIGYPSRSTEYSPYKVCSFSILPQTLNTVPCTDHIRGNVQVPRSAFADRHTDKQVHL